jgi:hypothetical protein
MCLEKTRIITERNNIVNEIFATIGYVSIIAIIPKIPLTIVTILVKINIFLSIIFYL